MSIISTLVSPRKPRKSQEESLKEKYMNCLEDSSNNQEQEDLFIDSTNEEPVEKTEENAEIPVEVIEDTQEEVVTDSLKEESEPLEETKSKRGRKKKEN